MIMYLLDMVVGNGTVAHRTCGSELELLGIIYSM